MIELNVHERAFWFNIKAKDNNRELIEYLSWQGLRWELRQKYDWYFKYRAALLQVKYPRAQVESYWGNQPAQGKTLEHLRKDKLTSKKAQITKAKNLLRLAKENWSSLFPIEDDPSYQKAVAKLARLENEYKQITA